MDADAYAMHCTVQDLLLLTAAAITSHVAALELLSL